MDAPQTFKYNREYTPEVQGWINCFKKIVETPDVYTETFYYIDKESKEMLAFDLIKN